MGIFYPLKLPLQVRVDMQVMEMKGRSTITKASKLEYHY